MSLRPSAQRKMASLGVTVQVEPIAIYNQDNQEGVVKQSQTGAVTQIGRICSPRSPQLHHGKSRGQRRKACCLHGLYECEAAGEHFVHYSWGFSYSSDVPQSNVLLVCAVAMNIYTRCALFKHASEHFASSKWQVYSEGLILRTWPQISIIFFISL